MLAEFNFESFCIIVYNAWQLNDVVGLFDLQNSIPKREILTPIDRSIRRRAKWWEDWQLLCRYGQMHRLFIPLTRSGEPVEIPVQWTSWIWLIDCRVWHCFTHRKVFVNLNQIVSLSEKHQGKLWLRTLRRPTFRSPWGQGWVAGTEGVEALWRSYITSLFPVHICSQFGWGWIQGHGTTCNYGCLGNMEGTQMNIYNGLTSHLQSIQTENTCSSCQSILKRLKSIFLNRVCCGTVRRKHDKTDCWSEDGRKPWPERLLGCRWEGCRCLWSFHVHSLKLT